MPAEDYKEFGYLEDANLWGFRWEGNNLRLYLDEGSNRFNELICVRAHSMVFESNYQPINGMKVQGPLLTTHGTIKNLNKHEIELSLDFGSRGYFSIVCHSLETKNNSDE